MVKARAAAARRTPGQRIGPQGQSRRWSRGGHDACWRSPWPSRTSAAVARADLLA